MSLLDTRALDITIQADELAPRLSRSHLYALQPLLEPRFFDTALVLSELVTNCVEHCDEEAMDLHIRVEAREEKIWLEVRDPGRGFPSEAADREKLGLRILDELSANWGVRHEGDFVAWAEMGRDPS